MALIGIAPLTLVRTTRGSSEYVYAGQVAPEDAAADDVKRLVKDGYLAKVADPAVTVIPDDPATGNVGEGVTVERPKAVATKPVWAQYRGLTEEQANDLTLDQLKDDEFMSSYQPAPPSA